MKNRDEAVGWLKRQNKKMADMEFSELGANVAWFLDKMWGLHHLNNTSLRNVDWSNGAHVDVNIDQSLATVDSNHLTRLVVIAHQMMLRIEVIAIAPYRFRLIFHQRTSRKKEDGLYKWCPTIEEHVADIVKYHPAIESELTQ